MQLDIVCQTSLRQYLLLFGMPVIYALAVSALIAPVAALVELYSKHGLDTVTVPIAASVLLGILGRL